MAGKFVDDFFVDDFTANPGVRDMNRPLRVLMVEDSEDDAALLLEELRRGGFDVAHERIETADDMRAALQAGAWDVVLSDYSMPTFSAAILEAGGWRRVSKRTPRLGRHLAERGLMSAHSRRTALPRCAHCTWSPTRAESLIRSR
jgi:CheY-like chemotaxis protein